MRTDPNPARLNPDDKVVLRGQTVADETCASFHLGHLTREVLLSLARNEGASREWRKAAVKIMIEKGFEKETSHPELYTLVAEIKREQEAHDEVSAVVESAIENEL